MSDRLYQEGSNEIWKWSKSGLSKEIPGKESIHPGVQGNTISTGNCILILTIYIENLEQLEQFQNFNMPSNSSIPIFIQDFTNKFYTPGIGISQFLDFSQ